MTNKPCGPECGDTICTECAIAYTYTAVRVEERERIVAIVRRLRNSHASSKYNRPTFDSLSVATTYAIEILDSILAAIYAK